MFTELSRLISEGNSLHMNIMKTNGKLVVLVVPQSSGVKDPAIENLIPLTLNGTAEELDAGFLGAISNPVMKATGLISNIAAFEKSVEKIAAESKVEKEKKDAINNLIKEAETLEKENKNAEALKAYKKILEQDKNNTKIQLKVNALKLKTGQKDMFFNVPDTPVHSPQKQPENVPDQTGFVQPSNQPETVQQPGNNIAGRQPNQHQTGYPQADHGNTQNVTQPGNTGHSQGFPTEQPYTAQQGATSPHSNPETYDNYQQPGSIVSNSQPAGQSYTPSPNTAQANSVNNRNGKHDGRLVGVQPDHNHTYHTQSPQSCNNGNRQQVGNEMDLFDAVLNS